MTKNFRWIPIAALVLAQSGFAAPADGKASATNCLNPASWALPDNKGVRLTAPGAVLSEMAKREVVLLGEHHDDEDHHRWQLQALAGLHAQRPDMALGFEMFPRSVQPVLDRWVAGELTVKQFLEEADWEKNWNVPAEMYLPLFQFARINRIPMVALNVDQKLNKAIVEKGWDAVAAEDREGVGRAAPPSNAYREYLFDVYQEHAGFHGKDGGKARKSDKAFRNFVESQTTWDRAMAEALSSRITSSTGGVRPLVVGIMGSGHIRFGFGVPHQLRDLGIKNVGTLIPVHGDADCEDFRPGFADAVFAIPRMAQAKAEPPRLGVRLEQKDGAVRIAEVVANSLAERSGLRSGDQLIEVGGQPAKKVTPVTASIRRHPGGSWLPLLVKRGEETLEVVIKFPVQP